MKILDLILGAISCLEIASKYTKNTADDKLSVELRLALEALRRVVNTPVLKSQTEKVEHLW